MYVSARVPPGGCPKSCLNTSCKDRRHSSQAFDQSFRSNFPLQAPFSSSTLFPLFSYRVISSWQHGSIVLLFSYTVQFSNECSCGCVSNCSERTSLREQKVSTVFWLTLLFSSVFLNTLHCLAVSSLFT